MSLQSRKSFINILKNLGYRFNINPGGIIIIEGGEGFDNLDMALFPFSMNSFPLREIPDDVTFINKGNVWLNNVTKIGNNVIFDNRGLVDLDKLENLNSTVQFNNKGFVSLRNLKYIPEGFVFNNTKGVYPLSLKMADARNVSFNKAANVALDGLDTREWDASIPDIVNGRLASIIIKSINR